MAWTTELWLHFWKKKKRFSLPHGTQSDSICMAFCVILTGRSSPADKAAGLVEGYSPPTRRNGTFPIKITVAKCDT